MEIPTVRVKHPELPGGMLINETDYDPCLHEPADQASAVRCEALATAKEAAIRSAIVTAVARSEVVTTSVLAEADVTTGGANLLRAAEPTEWAPIGEPGDAVPAAVLIVNAEEAAKARQARVAELGALSMVELKEKCADLGEVINPVGIKKVDLIERILELEAKATGEQGQGAQG